MVFSKDLNAASATPLILTILQKNPSYGYAIIRQVESLSEGKLNWEEGMLYPILHRMEKTGWIESFWGASETGRKRKYYRILELGEETLIALKEQWDEMDRILRYAWSVEAAFPMSEEKNNTGTLEEEDAFGDDLPVSLL